jgi:hypothetical protein
LIIKRDATTKFHGVRDILGALVAGDGHIAVTGGVHPHWPARDRNVGSVMAPAVCCRHVRPTASAQVGPEVAVAEVLDASEVGEHSAWK